MKVSKILNLMKQAEVIAENSPDEQTRVGSLLVHPESGAVIASGYNGFCRKCPDKHLPKIRPNKYPYMIHSEINLLLNCARHGIATNNGILVTTLSPCINCMRSLYQAGITEIIYKGEYKDLDEQINEMKDLCITITKFNHFNQATICPKPL